MAVCVTNGCYSSLENSSEKLNCWSDVEEVERLVRSRLEGNGGLAWRLGWSPLGGRGIIANANINPGDVIFIDTPIVIGPRGGAEGRGICIQCLRSGVLLKPCAKGCRLPVCSSSCQVKHSDSPECSLLIQLGVLEGESWSPDLYRALTPFRCLTVSQDDRTIISQLQAHPPNEISQEVKLLKRGLKTDLSKEDYDWMDLCCRVMDAVAFQAVTEDFETKQSAVRGLYPLAGLMNHTCTPNTRQVFDSNQRLKFIAVKPILKGDEVTTSYCPLLWATPVRISFLVKTKQFVCSCHRCQHPTELGTYLSGLRCNCGGMVMPENPQELKSSWKCSDCGRSLSSGQALVVTSILSAQPDKTINNLSLPSNNHIAVDNSLRKIFSERNNLKELNEMELEERESKIKQILHLIGQLELGECRTRGLLCHELHFTLEEKETRNTTKNDENKL